MLKRIKEILEPLNEDHWKLYGNIDNYMEEINSMFLRVMTLRKYTIRDAAIKINVSPLTIKRIILQGSVRPVTLVRIADFIVKELEQSIKEKKNEHTIL